MTNEQDVCYTQMLKKAGNYENIEDVKDCCISILTEFTQYNFCFIDFETKTHLGIFCTHSDFTERFVLISKKYIVSISMVYQQDIEFDEPNVSEYM